MTAPTVILKPGRRGTDATSAWVRALRLRLIDVGEDGRMRVVNTGIPAKDAKHLLLTLAQYVDHDGRCYPSIQTLADDTEMSWDSIRRRLADLEYLQLIVRFRRWQDNDGSINDQGCGRETSGEIRFLFDTIQDDIDSLLRARAGGLDHAVNNDACAAAGHGSDEDNTFAKFSPSGSLELMVANPALLGKFSPGEKYYLDFTPAD